MCMKYSMSTTITTIPYDVCHILLSNADLARLTGLPTRDLRSLQPMDSHDRVVATLPHGSGERFATGRVATRHLHLSAEGQLLAQLSQSGPRTALGQVWISNAACLCWGAWRRNNSAVVAPWMVQK